MNRKILFALSLVIVAVMAMGAVSAGGVGGMFDFGSLFGGGEPQDVTLDGITFHIPDGYEENSALHDDGNLTDYTYFTSTSYERGYTNGDSYINVRVVEYDGTDVGEELANYMDGTSKTVNGVSGYQYYDGIAYTFTYSMGQKVITIQSDNEELIGDVM